ncbi:hypothetical protein NL676_016816 [Syzygium grande]|nr:hypothetical protein NL676_016816 [Syzygium grande]
MDSSAAASPALTNHHPDLRAAPQPSTIPPTSAPCHCKGVTVAFGPSSLRIDSVMHRGCYASFTNGSALSSSMVILLAADFTA